MIYTVNWFNQKGEINEVVSCLAYRWWQKSEDEEITASTLQ